MLLRWLEFRMLKYVAKIVQEEHLKQPETDKFINAMFRRGVWKLPAQISIKFCRVAHSLPQVQIAELSAGRAWWKS